MAFTGWARKCQITIDSGAAEYDQSNFPWLFTEDILPSEMFDADGSYPALDGGGDIRFSSDADGNTRLSIEVVNFETDNDPANGKAEIWVKLPLLSNTTGATVYVWYGKSGESQPARDAAYGSEDVWSNGYAAVYHFNEDPSAGTLNDSSANENHGTAYNMESADLVDGPYGKAWAPDGTDEYVLVADSTSLEPSSVSILATVNLPSSQASGYPHICGKGYGSTTPYGSYNLQHENSATSITMQVGRSDGFKKSTATGVYTNQWIQLCGNTLENARYTNIWQNETRVDLDDHGTGSISYDSYGLGIFTTGDGADPKWIGQIEELRIRTAGSSEGYIDSTHRTQLEISTHTTVGTPETIPGSIAPSSITSDESWGTPQVNMQIQVGSISSSESFGTPSVYATQVIAPDSIPSSESWGTLQVDMQISVGSITSSESFGTPVISAHVHPSSITSDESFGTPQVDMQIQVGSITSDESFGTPEVMIDIVVIEPDSILSCEAFGAPQVDMQIQVDSIPSSEAWGTVYVNVGNTVFPQSIPSSESWGIPQLDQQIQVDSLQRSDAFGTPSVRMQIQVGSIPSSESFGTPELSMVVLVNSILSSESFGTPTISQLEPQTINVESIPSSESWGLPVVTTFNTVAPDSITSDESWGTPTLSMSIRVGSISSDESWGSPSLSFEILVESIPSSEGFGNPAVSSANQILVESISSSESWGTPSLIQGQFIFPESIQTSEAWGIPSVSWPQTISTESIPSSESFGIPVLLNNRIIQVESITSSESWGEPTLIIEQFIIIDPGIPSSESWGIPIVRHHYVNEFERMMETDMEEGFFNDTEFAMPVVVTYPDGYSHTVKAIFDNEFIAVEADTGAPMMSRNPVIWMQESKYLRQYDKGCEIQIQGVNYRCFEPQPDGTGLLVLELHHQKTV